VLAIAAVVVAIAADGGGDAEQAAEQVEPAPEQAGADRPTPGARRSGKGDRPKPGEPSVEPELGRSSGAEPSTGAEEGARPADILRSRNPLKRARRAGYEVLRATPGGADDVFDALGENGARVVKKLFGGGP
jgi:hypothetical protein